MDRAQLIEVLEDAGLSPYQAEAYVAVLEQGAAPATDISGASDVPDQRIYDVLRDLEKAGYIEIYEQESLHARAYSLDVVLEDLRTRATRFTEAAEEIERRWTEPAIERSAVSIVKQFDTVIKNAAESIRAADRQVQVAIATRHYDRLRSSLQTAVENGANVNLSISTPDADADSLPDPEDVETACTEVRHRRVPSPFVAIVDRTKTCFAPHEWSTNEYGLIVDDRTHTYVFHWFFLTNLWDSWTPYYTSSDGEFPTEYLDIRYCVQDVAPLVEEGATVRVSIEGTDIETGADRTVEGTVSNVIVSERGSAEPVGDIPSYGGRVGMIVETADGPVEVGGWGATVEEVEAHSLTVLSVE